MPLLFTFGAFDAIPSSSLMVRVGSLRVGTPRRRHRMGRGRCRVRCHALPVGAVEHLNPSTSLRNEGFEDKRRGRHNDESRATRERCTCRSRMGA